MKSFLIVFETRQTRHRPGDLTHCRQIHSAPSAFPAGEGVPFRAKSAVRNYAVGKVAGAVELPLAGGRRPDKIIRDLR